MRVGDPATLPTQMYITAEEPMKSLRVGGANNDVLIVAGFG